MEGYGCWLSPAAAMHTGEGAAPTLATVQSSTAKAHATVQNTALRRGKVHSKWFYTGAFALLFWKGTYAPKSFQGCAY